MNKYNVGDILRCVNDKLYIMITHRHKVKSSLYVDKYEYHYSYFYLHDLRKDQGFEKFIEYNFIFEA